MRYALVTPAHNEEKYIVDMIDSILLQTVLPARWIIVDDGSTDKTAAIVAAYAQRYEFIELLELPRKQDRRPGGEGAVGAAFAKLDMSEIEYIGRFDADLVFEPQYIGKILREFEADDQLGIAGGGLYVRHGMSLRLERVPKHHVRGAVKMYRKECFDDIGPLSCQIGWDTIDEVQAWTKGWTTKSFFRYRVIHRRPTGAGIAAVRLQWERGRAEYFTWSSPLFVAAKSLKIGLATTSPRQALSFLAGFGSCYIRCEARLNDKDFVKARRGQQAQRVLNILSLRLHAKGVIA